MKLKSGDRVKFLNDTGEGVLISFIDKNKALVRIDDGFEIPVMISELVGYGGDYFSDKQEIEENVNTLPESRKAGNSAVKTEKKLVSVKEKVKTVIIEDDEIVFAAKPSVKHTGINTWLANSSSWQLKYVVSRPVEEGNLLFSEGVLEADTKVFLGRFMPENLNEVCIFDFQFIFYKDSLFNKREPVAVRAFLDPEGVYNSKDLHENVYFNENALVLNLIDFKRRKENRTIYPDLKDIKNILVQKSDQNDGPAKEKKTPQADKPEEIDLHIENLLDDHRNMSNGEILNIQMDKFKSSLEAAIARKPSKIVFIHGVGNGKLKFEIRRKLEQAYPSLQYQDASFREYGFGATMVIIR